MEYKEQEISLSGLLVYIMRGWRSMICAMLILALALGGYGYVSTKDASAETASEELTAGLQKDVDNTIKKETQLVALEEYFEKSFLMQMNPFEVYEGNISFWIDTGHVINYAGETVSDNTSAIMASYVKMFEEENWRKDALKKIGSNMELPYFDELLSIKSQSDTIAIVIKYDNSEDIDAILDCIRTYVKSIYPEQVESFGTHKFIEVNSWTSCILDNDLGEKQQGKIDSRFSLTSSIAEDKEKFNSVQWDYYNEKLGIAVEEKQEKEPSVKDIMKSAIKFAVLGAVAGVFVTCAFRGAVFLFADKVRTCNGLEASLKIPCLGCIREVGHGKKKTIFHRVDKWIAAWGTKELVGLSQEQQIARVVSGIALYCEESLVDKVFLSVNQSIPGMKDLCTQVAKRLTKDEGISCYVVDEVMRTPEVAQGMKKSDGIVFLVKEHTSSYAQLAGGVSFCKNHGKYVLGVIVAV